MKHVQMRDAKARLSELVEIARKGEPVTITRHGAPAAVLVSVEDAQKLDARKKPKKTFVEHLLEFPGGIDLELERDHTPPREIDL